MSQLSPPIHCKHCSTDINLATAISESPYSWINLSAFWYVCPECKTGNHVRVLEERVEIIEITGAPGPTWDILQTSRQKDLNIRQDPEFLQVWLGDLHRAIPAR